MKTPISSIIVIAIALLQTACTATGRSPGQVASNVLNRESVTPTTHEYYPAKSPHTVAVYSTKITPPTAYRVIGVAHVSKYNLLGMQRPANTVHNMMKSLAASIGGDGLIDVNHTKDSLDAKVIAFQKIML